MENLNIKIKSDHQVPLEKTLPPPNLNYVYVQTGSESGIGIVQVICQEDIIHKIHEHANTTSNEVGGILIGDVYKWGGIYHVMVDACIKGDYMETGRAHAKFTAETWASAMSVWEKVYPDKVIVGWYHSHPNIGIFLSHMDLEIHKNFFKLPWHIAMVIDAQNNNMGFFGWDGQKISSIKNFSVTSQRDIAGKYEFSNHHSGIINYKNRFPIESPTPYPPKKLEGSWISFIGGIITGIVLSYLLSEFKNLFSKKQQGK